MAKSYFEIIPSLKKIFQELRRLRYKIAQIEHGGGGGGDTPTLQEVTIEGNITNKGIIFSEGVQSEFTWIGDPSTNNTGIIWRGDLGLGVNTYYLEKNSEGALGYSLLLPANSPTSNVINKPSVALSIDNTLTEVWSGTPDNNLTGTFFPDGISINLSMVISNFQYPPNLGVGVYNITIVGYRAGSEYNFSVEYLNSVTSEIFDTDFPEGIEVSASITNEDETVLHINVKGTNGLQYRVQLKGEVYSLYATSV